VMSERVSRRTEQHMALQLINAGGPPAPPTFEGRIYAAEWDKRAWTLVVDVFGSGRRLLQVPAYNGTPGRGDRVLLTGRAPLLRVQIGGVEVLACS
jgi:hypothetical protein